MATPGSSGLAARRCVPCRGGTPPLRGEPLAVLLDELGGGWRAVDEHHLEKEFRFRDFAGALAFANQTGALAEEQSHHPDLKIGWGRLGVRSGRTRSTADGERIRLRREDRSVERGGERDPADLALPGPRARGASGASRRRRPLPQRYSVRVFERCRSAHLAIAPRPLCIHHSPSSGSDSGPASQEGGTSRKRDGAAAPSRAPRHLRLHRARVLVRLHHLVDEDERRSERRRA